MSLSAFNALIITDDNEAKNYFDAVSFCGGGYFSVPLPSQWSAGTKLLGGYVRYPELSLPESPYLPMEVSPSARA